MQDHPADTQDGKPDAGQELPEELSQAGAVVAHAIKHMMGKNLPPVAIASALLGGSLGLLSRSMRKEAVLRVLENAMDSVRAGEFHED